MAVVAALSSNGSMTLTHAIIGVVCKPPDDIILCYSDNEHVEDNAPSVPIFRVVMIASEGRVNFLTVNDAYYVAVPFECLSSHFLFKDETDLLYSVFTTE